ncbi:hypothetical protein WDV85_14995 [Pseudokineococcus sp. 5B2Z-1]|uniref:fibronectin type III domain-containing protein n=1 Tax=Pseudokineococcus sp. 5B2Z-1 TaxID=3132744 RepID=UPI0030A12115
MDPARRAAPPARRPAPPAARPLRAALVVAAFTALVALLPGGGSSEPSAGSVAPGPSGVPVALGPTELVLGEVLFPPGMPRGVALTPTDRALVVRWDAVTTGSTLREYRVYLDGTLAATVPAGTTTTRLSGLVNGRSYSVAVSARGTNGLESMRSGAVTGVPVDDAPPPVPTGLVAVRGDAQVSLAWHAASDTDRTAVEVLRDGVRVTVLPAAVTSWTDTGLVNDRTYRYSLVAVDAAGNRSAASSPVVPATPTDLTAPAVPTGLRGVAGDESVSLTWDPGTDVDLAAVRVLQDGVVVAVLPAGTTSWTATGLEVGRTYRYALVAVDGHGNASAASTPPVEVVPLDLTPPGAVDGVVARPGDRSAELSWEPVTDRALAGYEVLDADGVVVARVDAPATAVRLSDLADDVEVTYRVVAVDRAGNRSTPSAPVAVTPHDDVPPAAVEGVAVAELDRALEVTWSPVADAVAYRVVLDGVVAADVPAGSPPRARLEDLQPGVERSVVVLAVDAAGNVSAAHEPVLATPRDLAPSAPSGVVAVPGERPGEVAVSWAAPLEDDVVEHRVLVDGEFVALVPGATEVLLTELAEGAEVEVVVVAVDAAGSASPTSAVVRVRVPSSVPPYLPLVPPAESSGTATGAGLAATRDGRWVVVSTAARLEAGDANAAPELHLLDRVRGTSRRVAPLPASWGSATTDSTNASAVVISEDGRYLALSTTARLVPEDRNSLLDAYRLDLRTGEWALVSAPAAGGASSSTAGVLLPTGSSVYARSPGLAMTADGSTVLFLSARSDLVADDRNGVADVFAKDLTTGQVRRVSTSSTGGETPLRATGPALAVTPDGRYAVFPAQASGRPLVLVRKDLVTGELLVASTAPRAGSTPVEVSVFRDTGDVAVSDDGRYVAFSTAAKPAAPTTSWSTGLAYRKDLVTEELAPLGTGQTAAWEHQLGLDPTGRYGFVATAAPLLAEDGNRRTDHYRRDLETGELRLVTSRADGSVAPSTSGSVTPAEYGRVLVLGADRVLVGTVLPLVDGDANGLLDVYGRDLARGEAGAVVG